VVGLGFGDAVAVGLGGELTGGVLGNGADELDAGGAANGGGQFGQLAIGITLGGEDLAGGGDEGGDAVGTVVAVLGAVVDAPFVAGLTGEVAARVVGEGGAATGIADLAEAADAVAATAARVPGVGEVFSGSGVADGEGTIEGVPGVGFDDAAGIAAGEQVAGAIVGGGGGAPVGLVDLQGQDTTFNQRTLYHLVYLQAT